ncbi:PREDICTED: putative F-box protein At3g23260 [Camelina sativa]|uniref:F-box protein At3g23260 n=1 Tax=Camelina sativa TaxID=90675 RepID=A0ABM0T8N5_CAMSA|nr:PREDICTED: putative F-box protein At3g23260 [Camelina sativa]
MDWSSLPTDLQEEVLSRVPAKSLTRLRSTSKQWNTLSKLANVHSTNAQKESLIVMLENFRVFLVRANYLHELDINIAPSVNVTSQFYLEHPQFKSSQVDICNVFHCDGLLLCSTEDDKLVVFNPCSGETKWIEPRNHYKNTDFYALGYDNNKSSCKKFKVLRVDRRHVRGVNNEYEIYDFTTDSWRFLGPTTNWLLPQSHRGVSVKGNTYWVACYSGRPYHEFLLNFDYSTEGFRKLPLPHQFGSAIKVLSVVRENQLCLCVTISTELHVWVTAISTESVMVIWRRLFKVNASLHYEFSNGVSLLTNEQNKLMFCCNNYIYVSPDGGNVTCKLPLAEIQQGLRDM